MKIQKGVRKRILILCEDEKSSLLYFKSFKKDEEFKRNLSAVSVEVIHPEHCSPLGLVKEATKRKEIAESDKNSYDEIWVVFDKDSHGNIPNAFNIARKENINIAISIICFEFWILLHFAYTTMPFNKCGDLIKYIKTNHLKNYEKCSNCFKDIRDKINNAIRNAKLVEKSVEIDLNRGKKIYQLSAYTNVHHLISKLIPKK